MATAYKSLAPGPTTMAEREITLDIRLQRTRKRLRVALLELLRVRPVDQISIREITAKAGVGYATFYRHYAAKEGLLHELADAEVRQLIGVAMPAIFETSMQDSCRIVCERVLEHRGLWRAMLIGDISGVLRQEFIREVLKLKPREPLDDWIPEELQLICSTGATLDVLAWWVNQKMPRPIDEVADMLAQIIGVLSRRKDG
jgi:AcrR family transcriptional regulator